MEVTVKQVYASVLAALLFAQSAHGTPTSFAEELKNYLSTKEGREVVGKAVLQYQEELESDAAKAELEEKIKNPVKIDVGESPVKGPGEAKVTVIEFSDFECPYCREASDTLGELLKRYPKEVKLSFKHLPLPFHTQATPAALASMAAHEQGKFWEYHDKLFEQQDQLGAPTFEKIAREIGLDIEKFKQDITSEEIKRKITEDEKLAEKLEIEGTPAIFVNGVQFTGIVPIEDLSNLVDRLMSEKR